MVHMGTGTRLKGSAALSSGKALHKPLSMLQPIGTSKRCPLWPGIEPALALRVALLAASPAAELASAA